MTFFGEDIPDLIEKPCTVLKSQEELERLTVDERLDPIERSVYLLSSGQEVQRVSVVYSLPHLLTDHYIDCVRRIIPKIREVVRVADADMQLAACDVFTDILRRNICPVNMYTQYFLQTMFQCMDCKDQQLADRWVGALIDVINLLPKEIVAKEILSKTIAGTSLGQPVRCRMAYCRLLGAAVGKYDSTTVIKDILPMVKRLCEDVDYDVRACMARHLEPVAKSLSSEAIHSDLLPVLVELRKDEQCEVRLAWLDAIISLLPMLGHPILVDEIIPLLIAYCKEAQNKKDGTLRTVAWNFGRLCHGLAGHLDEEQRQYFLGFYRSCLCRLRKNRSPSIGNKKQLPQKSGKPVASNHGRESSDEEEAEVWDHGGSDVEAEECRRCAAYNMPAMVLFVTAKQFRAELLKCFISLCSDNSCGVRQNIAAGFHEVVTVLKSQSACLLDSLISILSDNTAAVLSSGFMSHLPNTFEVLSQTRAAELKTYDILSAMVKCESVVFSSNDWRLQIQYADALADLPRSFSMDALHLKIVPLAFRKLASARAVPVRKAMARAVLHLIRHTSSSNQREALCKRLIDEFAHAHSYHHRVLYIEVCDAAIDIYSRVFFTQNFANALLLLHADKVANVRMRLCSVLPRVKGTLRLPRDKELVALLQQCVRNLLLKETDRDVMEVRDTAVEGLDKICVEAESGHGSTGKDDEEDLRKEKEEQEIFDRLTGTPDRGAEPGTPLRRVSSVIPPVKEGLKTVRRPPQRSGSGARHLTPAPRRSVGSSEVKPVSTAGYNGSSLFKTTIARSQSSLSTPGAAKKKVTSSLSSGATNSSTNSVSVSSGIGTEAKKLGPVGYLANQRRGSLTEFKNK